MCMIMRVEYYFMIGEIEVACAKLTRHVTYITISYLRFYKVNALSTYTCTCDMVFLYLLRLRTRFFRFSNLYSSEEKRVLDYTT